jgi:hypothetical protein
MSPEDVELIRRRFRAARSIEGSTRNGSTSRRGRRGPSSRRPWTEQWTIEQRQRARRRSCGSARRSRRATAARGARALPRAAGGR